MHVHIVRRFGLALFLVGWCGCAHLATVKTKPARMPAGLTTNDALAPARNYLAAAEALERRQPLRALADNLLAAKISYNALALRPDDIQARNVYDFAVARSVESIQQANLQPWRT